MIILQVATRIYSQRNYNVYIISLVRFIGSGLEESQMGTLFPLRVSRQIVSFLILFCIIILMGCSYQLSLCMQLVYR